MMKRVSILPVLALLACGIAHAGTAPYMGDYLPGDTIDCDLGAVRPSSGASFTLGGTPAISVYKDNGTTESTTGVTLTADFDTRTGYNHLRITTASDGTFYSAGSWFSAVITTGTVDSVSVVGQPVCSFTLAKTSGLRPTTANRTLDIATTGEAGIDLGNIRVPVGAIPVFGISDNDTAQAVSSTTITLSNSTPIAADDRIIGGTVYLTASGITGYISDYVNSTKVATVTWSGGVTPTGTPAYQLFATATPSSISADVWSNASRTVTSAANITSTGGTIPINSSRVDASVGAYQSGQAPLQPTVAGRTLDVSSTGEAGIDMANVGSPSSVVALSGTTIGTVSAVGASGITASSLAPDSITAAKVAADVTPEIQSGLATAAALTTVGNNVTSLQAAVAALNNLSASQVGDIIIETQGGGVKLKCAMSAFLAYVAGDLSTTGGNSTYKDPSGSETRITGIVSSPGNRLGAITCPTYP